MKRLQEYVEDRCIRLATLLDAGEDIYHEAEKALFRSINCQKGVYDDS